MAPLFFLSVPPLSVSFLFLPACTVTVAFCVTTLLIITVPIPLLVTVEDEKDSIVHFSFITLNFSPRCCLLVKASLSVLSVTFVMSLTTAWRLYVWSLIHQYPRTAENKLLKLFVYPFLWLYRCHSNPPAAHSLLCFCPAGVPGVAHSWRAVLPLSFPLMCPLSGSFSVLVSFVISAGIIIPRFGVIYHRRPRRRHTSNHGGRVSTWKQIRGKAGVHLNKNM